MQRRVSKEEMKDGTVCSTYVRRYGRNDHQFWSKGTIHIVTYSATITIFSLYEAFGTCNKTLGDRSLYYFLRILAT